MPYAYTRSCLYCTVFFFFSLNKSNSFAFHDVAVKTNLSVLLNDDCCCTYGNLNGPEREGERERKRGSKNEEKMEGQRDREEF